MNEANSTAVPTKIRLCISVATIVKVTSFSSDAAPVAAATIPTAMSVPIRPTRKATTEYQAGQRGAADSGSSGRSGGGGEERTLCSTGTSE